MRRTPRPVESTGLFHQVALTVAVGYAARFFACIG